MAVSNKGHEYGSKRSVDYPDPKNTQDSHSGEPRATCGRAMTHKISGKLRTDRTAQIETPNATDRRAEISPILRAVS